MLRRELFEAGAGPALQESEGSVPIEALQVQGDGDVREGEADSAGGGKETAAASVQPKQPIKNEDAAPECGVGSGDAGSGQIISPPPLRDDRDQEGRALHAADDGMEPEATRHQPQTEGVDAPAALSPGDLETSEASEERKIAEGAADAECSSRRDETGPGGYAPHNVLDRGASEGVQEEDRAAHPEDARAGVNAADLELRDQDARQQTEDASPQSDPSRPSDVQTDPEVDASTADVLGQAAPESDTSLSSPVGMQKENLCGWEGSSEDRASFSADALASSSGLVDRQTPEEEDEVASPEDAKAPLPRRPTPPEDAREYVVAIQDVCAVDREYARWNSVVAEQLLLANPSSEEAYLCVNPRILARVYEESGLGLLTSEQAEQQFTTAIANLFQRRVLGHSARLRVLRRCSSGGLPDCTAFLAGSVLAAFRMQSDEEASGSAYYRRLADLLGCGMQGVHPVGFDPAVFESLWVFLHNWLREVHGRQLAMPKGDVGLRRFVALPLAHVPLRSLDVDKLPAFFSWAGYQPGGRVRHDRLLSDLKRWQQSRNVLTPTGAEALSDDRSAAVAAQVSAELESWDGGVYESASKRSALVEIQFDVVQRSPVFFYLPRRPPGFPEIFDGGERVFEASDEGWYDPAQVRPEDGELLETGFEWPSHASRVLFTLRRPGSVVVPLIPSCISSGFLSGRRLMRGVRCSVLCRDSILGTVRAYLSEVAQGVLNPLSHPLLPSGWSMFRDFTARVHIEAPAGLEALEVDPNVELIVAGGLRIGRRWSWLAGMPPQIFVSGMEAQDRIRVNDTPVEVGANGELLTGDVLAAPGEYVIEAGRVRRRIEIARPQVSARCEDDRNEPIDNRHRRIALPHGSWTLIGRSPDQVCRSQGGFFRGSIASCPFQPIWAVQVGAGPGAVVAALAGLSPPRPAGAHRLTGQTLKMIERWTSTIYEAQIRRPRFIGLDGAVPETSVIEVWKQYTALAKQIKRRLKRPR